MLAAALAVMIDAAWADDSAARAALAHAIQAYLDGDAPKSRQELRQLLAQGADLPTDVRRQAMLWMGDLLFAEGGPVAAKNYFETLLSEEPDYPIDPYAHSPECVAYFESVRSTIRRPERPPDPVPLPTPRTREPWPWKSVLPGGIGWFVDKKPATGAVVGGLQLASLGVSVVTYVQLRDTWPGDWPDGGEFSRDHPEDLEAWNVLLAVNRSAATVGFLAYLVPIGIETGTWAGRRATVSVGPSSVMFSANF